MSPILKRAGFVILVFLVGVGGVMAGAYLRDSMSKNRMRELSQRVPHSLLAVGMRLPPVVLTNGESARQTTDVALGDDGGVVLFLDLECSPCVDMCERWQRAIDSGRIDASNVVGITYHPVEVAARFREEHALSFEILQDQEQKFRADYRVDRFPLEVVVGPDGRIQSLSYDVTRPIDESLYGMAERH